MARVIGAAGPTGVGVCPVPTGDAPSARARTSAIIPGERAARAGERTIATRATATAFGVPVSTTGAGFGGTQPRRPCPTLGRPRGPRVARAARARALPPGAGPRAAATGATAARRARTRDLVASTPAAPYRRPTSNWEPGATVPTGPSPQAQGDPRAEPRATAGRVEPKERRRTATGTPRGGDGRSPRPIFYAGAVCTTAIRLDIGDVNW